MPPARLRVRLRPRGRGDELLGVAPSRVAIVRGLKSRDKLIEVEGIAADELPKMLAEPGIGG